MESVGIAVRTDVPRKGDRGPEAKGRTALDASLNAGRLARCAVAFEAADPPRSGRVLFWDPAATIPEGEPVALGASAVGLPVEDAVPVLIRVRHDPAAHPAAAFWGAATLLGLHLVARGRILPGITPGAFDAWRVGPLDRIDGERLWELVAAMPAQAQAGPGTDPQRLADPLALVRGFLDAVADTLPRTVAADQAAGAFATVAERRFPQLRGWADRVAADTDTGVRVSLRLEVVDGDLERGELRAVVQVHSLADPARVLDAAELWSTTDDRFGRQPLIDTVLALRRGAIAWPPLQRLLSSAVPGALLLDDDEVNDLLTGASAPLAEAGIEVHWPRELVHDLTARAVAGSRAARSDGPSFFGGTELLDLNWQLALGGDPLTEAEMNALAQAHRPVVRLRDQWMLFDPGMAAKARHRKLPSITPIDALAAALTGTAQVGGEQVAFAAGGWLDTVRARISRQDDGAEPVRQPAALAATLRGYQLRGLRWLVRMTSLGLGACLADDMGLGKTVTLIALHLYRQEDPATAGPTLVVCPASLLGNWEREIARFAPGVPVYRFHGGGRTLPGAAGGFVLTTYATLRLDAARLANHHWAMLVADEAQHAKNPRSGVAKALHRIPAGARVALTGTPVENNLSELWAILDWTTPGLLGTQAAFRDRWARKVENGDRVAAEQLARLIGPFVLRRRKSDPGIAPELPRKTQTDRPVGLTHEQAALYQAVVRETLDQIRSSAGIQRRGLILRLLTALKQICNHPAQYLKEAQPRLAGRSGKLETLNELLDIITAEGGAALVFTQYVAMGQLLERHLRNRGISVRLLHGGTPVRRRDELVRRFQAGEFPVLALSLKAAGTGLNLTRADHVVHYDRWWNPAVEDQATDRAYRIGQTRPVQVHRLIAEGTIEDRIAAMLASKQDLAESVLSLGEIAFTELSDADLADLVELRSAS